MGSNLNKKAYSIKLAERIKATERYTKEGEDRRKTSSAEIGNPAFKTERGWWKK